MRFSMLYSGEQILLFKPCLVFYAGDSLNKSISKSQVGLPVCLKLSTRNFECSIYTSMLGCSINSYAHVNA